MCFFRCNLLVYWPNKCHLINHQFSEKRRVLSVHVLFLVSVLGSGFSFHYYYKLLLSVSSVMMVAGNEKHIQSDALMSLHNSLKFSNQEKGRHGGIAQIDP